MAIFDIACWLKELELNTSLNDFISEIIRARLLQVLFQKRMIKLAEQTFNIRIEKKSDTK